MKKLLAVLLAVLCMCMCVGCKKENEAKEEEATGSLSDYCECIVDFDCEVEESGFTGAYIYNGKGTINITIKKYSSLDLKFDNVQVKLIIDGSLGSKYWQYCDETGCEDSLFGTKRKEVYLTLSEGGYASHKEKVEIKNYVSYTVSLKDRIEDVNFSAYIYKEEGEIIIRK